MPPFIGQAILLCFIFLLATPTWAQTQTPELIDTLHKIKKKAPYAFDIVKTLYRFLSLKITSQSATLLICATLLSRRSVSNLE